MHTPIDVHYVVVERILCYLKKNLGSGLLYSIQDTPDIDAYTDIDRTESIENKGSTKDTICTWEES